jgi:hypothetical protein
MFITAPYFIQKTLYIGFLYINPFKNWVEEKWE